VPRLDGSGATTPLAKLLRRRIAAAGPIGVAEYMAEALGHPRYGYYTRRDPLGRDGDFITAPEISQMFGELIGLWCAAVWQAIGRPDPLRLIELGPGRGTLIADGLRAAARTVPEFSSALRLHLVETSPVLRDRQRRSLAPIGPRLRPAWHRSLSSVPRGPVVVVANEFFDALPVHQYVRVADGWRERMVGLSADGGRFRFVLEPTGNLDPPPAADVGGEGDLVEVCPDATATAGVIGERVARDGGAALIIDYGHPRSAAGDTLQAVRRHLFDDVLDRPGEADLTHHVDFETLGRAASAAGARPYGPIPQGVFLARLGIEQRAATLLASATPEQAVDIRAALHRLVHPREMGDLFKAVAIAHPDFPPPPGFD
jgi:NADH dehydrogenase [ubiquinone] 1 alpha subcomplex assembly factor 7